MYLAFLNVSIIIEIILSRNKFLSIKKKELRISQKYIKRSKLEQEVHVSER